MHVAMFAHRYPPALGGSESYFGRLADFLARQGDSVDVWTSNAVDLEAFWQSGRRLPAGAAAENGVTVRRYRPWRWPGRRYLLKAASLLPGSPMRRAMTLPCNPIMPGMWRDAGRSGGRCDAVFASAFPYAWPVACGLRLARRLGVPFFVTPFLHLGDERTRRQYTSTGLAWLLRQADGVFVQTPTEAEAVIGLDVDRGRVVLQGLGVEPAECTGGDRAASRSRWGVGEGVVVGHLANQSEEKGTCDLLRAVSVLKRRGVTCRVVLAGPDMANFRRFWADFPDKDCVTRLGRLGDAERRDFFAGIDVFCLPSRCDSFGLVLPEAWANGKPNVAYAAGGVADVIRHERDGLMTPVGDIGLLADGLARLIGDAGFRCSLGANGRDRLAADFDWGRSLGLVRDALAAGRRDRHRLPILRDRCARDAAWRVPALG